MTEALPGSQDLPPARFLSNGTLVSLVTGRGTGFIADGEIAVTRWNPDPLGDAGGVAWWVRDRESGPALCVGGRWAPQGSEALSAEPAPGVWEICDARDGLETRMTCWVAPGMPAECRVFEIVNRSARSRTIDLTGCAEVVLHHAAADASHPVFSKLFVQTEWRAGAGALLARRRPRAAGEEFPWLLHALDGPGESEHETDRARFLGRGRGAGTPAALERGAALSGTVGNVLDPVLAMRRIATLGPGERATWRSLAMTGPGADALLASLDAMRGAGAFEGSRSGAEAAERARRRAAGLEDAAADSAHRFLSALASRDPALRAAAPCGPAHATPDAEAAAGLSPGAWLVVADARDPAVALHVRSLARVQRYARSLGLPVELLVLARDAAAWGGEDAPGLVTRDADALGEARLAHLAALARAWSPGTARSREASDPAPVRATPAPGTFAPEIATHATGSREALGRFNGLGGFTPDGGEYVIRLAPGSDGRLELPPAPWINVIANPGFGCLVSETGAGFTWSGNSREHRITPWLNDPVLDPHGEALYVRDEATGRVWSPLPGPIAAGSGYEVRHRPGCTTWSLEARGLVHRTTVFVPPDAPVRIARLEIANRGAESRRLRLVSYLRFVMGVSPGEPGTLTTCDVPLGAVLARNLLSSGEDPAIAWAAAVWPSGATFRIGDDAGEFLGPGGRTDRPLGLATGTAPAVACRGDAAPAAILEVTVEIPPGESCTCAFLLGAEAGRDAVETRLASLRAPGAIERALADATSAWDTLASRLQVATPEPGIDWMVNHWLPYQNLSCRLWGRSALYQSGGAFGFRDQLQDASALVWLRPDLTREQILLNAAHQFLEGDVLHWWHPPRSRGLRTRFADDLLWLPWIAAFYVAVTGDASVLDESRPFLAAPQLEPGEQERYLEPTDSGERASVYEHAARAIDRSLASGARGLPLFGCGDWNDGMNRVGHEGRGESVWMAFFLHAAIASFAPHAERRGDSVRLARWREHQSALERALESAGWDGAWYRRGYYDDGTPLGSATSDECRIDALAQAWSVLSNAVPRERAETAMRSALGHLVSESDGLVRLLAPPFDRTPHDPGYIKGYVPGVRENGGQYTHAALWVVRAMAELGWRDHAAATLAMLSPIAHAGDPESVARYRVEPYVIAADVYGAPPHVGRGGWTWYTGSAGWMFRVAVESILGLSVEHGSRLRLRPCLPDEWPEARLEWRVPGSETLVRIRYRNPTGCAAAVRSATLDGAPIAIEGGAACTALPADGAEHDLEVILGARDEPVAAPSRGSNP